MLKLRTLGIGIALAMGFVMATGCGETVYQIGTTPPPTPEAPPPPPAPPAPEPEPVKEAPKIAEDTGEEIKINLKINFENNSAVLMPDAKPIIEAVANIMKGHKDINFVEVAGHASATGDANHNLVLTRKRAASVVQALVDQGIEANRLRGVGYGFYCELAGGSEDANRRVEFKVLRRGGKPTSYKWGGCSNAETKGIKPAPIPATAPTQ